MRSVCWITAFLKLDPADLPECTSSEFREYRTQELRVLYDFHGNETADEYHGRITRDLKNCCVVHMMPWGYSLGVIKITSTQKRVNSRGIS